MKWPSLLLLPLAFIAGEAAALEKCLGADGKVSYSDRPCAAGAKRSSVGGGSFGDATVEYYDVGGPGAHLAHTDWYLSYRNTARGIPGGGCQVGDVTTRLDLKVRMPRWNPPAGADPQAVSNWSRYISALEVHESGHLQHGRDLESSFKRTAAAIKAASCGEVDRMLRQRFDAMVKDAQALDVQYDAQTNHGATQGAHYP